MKLILTWRNALLAVGLINIVGLLMDARGNFLESQALQAISSDYSGGTELSDSTNTLVAVADNASVFGTRVAMGTFVLFLIATMGWMYAIAAEAFRRKPNDLSGPGWAIGGWFLPFYNFYGPRKVTADAMKVVVQRPAIGILTAWWIIFWITSLANRFLGPLTATNLDSLANAADSASWDAGMKTVIGNYQELLSVNVLELAACVLLMLVAFKARDFNEPVDSELDRVSE